MWILFSLLIDYHSIKIRFSEICPMTYNSLEKKNPKMQVFVYDGIDIYQ